MSTPKIYGFPQSTYVWTARAVCAAKGVEVEFVPITPPEHKSDVHLARHPYGKVPAFEHGALKLFETSAIARYVDTAFDGPSLQPSDPATAAIMNQWISVTNSYFYNESVPNYIFAYIFPGTDDRSPDRTRIDAALPKLKRTLALYNDALAEATWLAGETMTLADYFFAPLLLATSNFPEAKAMLSELPHLGRYIGQVVEIPAVMSVAPPK